MPILSRTVSLGVEKPIASLLNDGTESWPGAGIDDFQSVEGKDTVFSSNWNDIGTDGSSHQVEVLKGHIIGQAHFPAERGDELETNTTAA